MTNKKITRKNKIKLQGSWNSMGLEVYWHPKSDYLFMSSLTGKKRAPLEPLGKFGNFVTKLSIKINDMGNAVMVSPVDFDLAVMREKMKIYGFKNYKIVDDYYIVFKSKDESAMFQVYFSEFIK